MKINKSGVVLLAALLVGGLAGCQNVGGTGVASTEEDLVREVEGDGVKNDDVNNEKVTGESSNIEGSGAKEEAGTTQGGGEKKASPALKEEDLTGSYWRAVYFESFPIGDMEGYMTEYDDAYFRFMDVAFYDDKTVDFRSVVGNNYESSSGKGQWRITEKGDAIVENITPFEGMGYGYGFVPRFASVASEDAPNHEAGLISLEYMEGCVYFQKMENREDPFEGVDLASVNRVKEALERAKMNGQDITGEWTLLSHEENGNIWYALESGVEGILYVSDNYVTYQCVDSYGFREVYFGMPMTYDDMALYSDAPCDYAFYFRPNPIDYEGMHEYVSFGMAPEGEYLVVQMTVCEIGQEYPTQSYLVFQRGFG